MAKNKSRIRQQKRKKSIRAKIRGTEERPRVSVMRSNKYFYAQAIDDVSGKTLMQINSRDAKKANTVEGTEKLGEEFGKMVKASKKVKTILYDRSGYKYHGKVKAFAEGIRKAGVEF
jgi:large subunit ribosomal protein L18